MPVSRQVTPGRRVVAGLARGPHGTAPESATLVAAMAHDAPPDATGTAIDALFALPLAEFTPARNALAAALKKAGDKVGAESVKALPRPSATAWAVNQVWWRQREVLGRVIDAGAAQRAAHVAWSHGRKADLRETAQVRDAAVRAAIDAAAAALSPGKPAAADAQYRMGGTIQALASSGWPAGQGPLVPHARFAVERPRGARRVGR